MQESKLLAESLAVKLDNESFERSKFDRSTRNWLQEVENRLAALHSDSGHGQDYESVLREAIDVQLRVALESARKAPEIGYVLPASISYCLQALHALLTSMQRKFGPDGECANNVHAHLQTSQMAERRCARVATIESCMYCIQGFEAVIYQAMYTNEF